MIEESDTSVDANRLLHPRGVVESDGDLNVGLAGLADDGGSADGGGVVRVGHGRTKIREKER